MEYYFAIKRNTIESVLMRWMNLEPILQSEFCYRDKYRILTHSSVQPLSCVQLQPHGLQHTRPPCPSPTPGACLNSSPSSRWCHSTILSSDIPFSSCLVSFPVSGTFPVSQFFPSGDQSIGSCGFSISPSNKYLGLISFRMDWLDLLAVQGTLKSSVRGTLKSSPIPQFKSINSLALSFLYSPTLTSIHD